jgi:hypothetical protein
VFGAVSILKFLTAVAANPLQESKRFFRGRVVGVAEEEGTATTQGGKHSPAANPFQIPEGPRAFACRQH